MGRRDTLGRKPAKTRRRKPKRGSAAATARQPNRSVRNLQERLRCQAHELEGARDERAAIADVLRIISNSPGELEAVFQTILTNAVRICGAKLGDLYLREADGFRMATSHNAPPAYVEARTREPVLRPPPDAPLGRLAVTKQLVQIADIKSIPSYIEGHPFVRAAVDLAGYRTVLVVPMLKDDQLIGAIGITRKEIEPFTERQIALVQNFADQAVIAIENARLLDELRQRTDDLTESLEQQTATSEVLRVISSSTDDLQPVFDAMLANAIRLCEASYGTLWLHEGDGQMRAAALHGGLPDVYLSVGTVFRPKPSVPSARAMSSRKPIQLVDLKEDKSYLEGDPLAVTSVDVAGIRTVISVPMVKDDVAIGTMTIYRREVRPFTDKQIELVGNFAAQAVIAIENARLLTELRESLQQQTATAEVLKVISRSTFDLQIVLKALIESAARLCHADKGSFRLARGEFFHHAASYGYSAEQGQYMEAHPVPAEGDRGSIVGRVLDQGKAVQVEDTKADPEFKLTNVSGFESIQTTLGVPLLREGRPIGVLVLMRSRVERFSEKQVELVITFADQAVIAIENARLLNELRESLEQQTATADVLKVISSSPGDLEPVFQAMLENATRICDASSGSLFRFDGSAFIPAAQVGLSPEYAEFLRQRGPFEPLPGGHLHRVMRTKQVSHTADDAAERGRGPGARLAGARSTVCIPMLKDNVLVGAFFIYRTEVRPFTDKQIALLQNFAAQAVIAIENARLLNELRSSLERQTATSNVLAAISRSPGDLEPVFSAMLENAVRICGAKFGVMYRHDDGTFWPAAKCGVPQQVAEFLTKRGSFQPDAGTPLAELARTRQPIKISDITEQPATAPRASNIGGARSFLLIPMLKETMLIGGIAIYRQEIQPFTEEQIELVQNFAAQAVIAIENARLLSELRQRTNDLSESLEQQTATSEVLHVISRSPGDLKPVFQTMLENATRICAAKFGVLQLYEDDAFRIGAIHNAPPAFAEHMARREPLMRPTPQHPFRRMVMTKEVVQIADLMESPAYKERDPGVVSLVERASARTFLAVPMLKENEVVGVIAIYRQEVRAFTDKQVAVVVNFANQAVIAIENIRLLNELRESLQQQTATADVLKVISRSPTNVQPVFDAILSSAVRLLRGYSGVVTRIVADHIELAAFTSIDDAGDASLRALFPQSLKSEIPHARAIRDRAPINIADAQTEPYSPESVRAAARARAYRSWVTVPLLRHDEAIGTIAVTRREPSAFNDDEISLLRTFADQAVIAIENARLFDEVQTRNRDLTALGEVGRAVNSTLDAETVLRTIVTKAVELSTTDAGAIYVFDEEHREFRLRATYGMSEVMIAAITDRHIGLGDANIGEAARRREPIQIADLREAPASALNDIILGAGYRALLVVPLLGPEGIVGALVVRRKRPGEFTPAVVSLMQNFADQSVIALENARLFEEIAQKSRELEIASRHKSQFVANMSHELRTPLAAMLGYAELMQEGIYEPLGEKSLAALTRIRSNGKHLLGLINTVLDIAKIESGQFTLNMQEYSIETVVETVRVATESLAQNKKLALTTAVTKPLPIGIGDEQRLTQVLLNLVGNAIKFTDTGEVRVTAEAVDGHFAIRVVDTGPGIPEQERTRIFEQFHQVDDSNTKAKGGTGLGLAIAKQIVEMHGGRIWVDSTVGKGSAFQMELPIRAKKMTA